MHPELDALVRAPYYDTYLQLLESADIQAELARSEAAVVALFEELTDEQLALRYQSDKWSIRQVIHHCIQCEMILNYRAMKIGREETTQNLPGFDEKCYEDAAVTGGLDKQRLLSYFLGVRASTRALADTFSALDLERVGIVNGNRTSVKALFFVTAAHTLHHVKVVRERYLS